MLPVRAPPVPSALLKSVQWQCASLRAQDLNGACACKGIPAVNKHTCVVHAAGNIAGIPSPLSNRMLLLTEPAVMRSSADGTLRRCCWTPMPLSLLAGSALLSVIRWNNSRRRWVDQSACLLAGSFLEHSPMDTVKAATPVSNAACCCVVGMHVNHIAVLSSAAEAAPAPQTPPLGKFAL